MNPTCSPDVLIGFVIAAEAFIVGMGFIFAAMLTSSNPFTSGGSPVLLGIALANIALAIGSLGVATSRMPLCTFGPCAAFGNTAFALALALLASLTVMAAATAGTIVPSAIPFAGAVLVTALGFSLLATGAMFPELATSLARLEVCVRGLPAPSVAGEIAIVLGYVVLGVAIVTGGAVGNRSPFGTNKG